MKINGHNLYIEQHGPHDGPLVVLLHHGLGSVKAWKEQISTLVESGYQVLAYDRWGYGMSDARIGLDVPTFSTDLEDLSAILDLQGNPRPALVGHSDGGTIGFYFAARHPERVGSLIAIAAHIYVSSKMEGGILGVKQAFENDERFRIGLQHAHGEKYESTFYNWFDGWYRSGSLNWDMRPILNKIHCPVLVVQGQEDEHTTPEYAKDIARAIPGAELWLLPGAGHMLPQEHADQFNQKMLEFLKLHQEG